VSNKYFQDPEERLGYSWDWSDWLAGVSDTIESATVTIPEGLTAVEPAVIAGAFVTQRVSGGTVDDTYKMVCKVTTTGGLVVKELIYVTIREK
jgi:hypothetical protein